MGIWKVIDVFQEFGQVWKSLFVIFDGDKFKVSKVGSIIFSKFIYSFQMGDSGVGFGDRKCGSSGGGKEEEENNMEKQDVQKLVDCKEESEWFDYLLFLSGCY